MKNIKLSFIIRGQAKDVNAKAKFWMNSMAKQMDRERQFKKEMGKPYITELLYIDRKDNVEPPPMYFQKPK